MKTSNLPIHYDLKLIYGLSLVVAVFMTVVSVAGLLYPSTLYPTDALLHNALPNDVVNLVIVLPLLLGSMWFARRGKLLGLLFWPGALFCVFYNYIAYVFGMPLNAAFPLGLMLVTTSAYTLIALIASIDGPVVRQRLTGVIPEKLAGGALMGYGALFFLLVLGNIAQALTGQRVLPEADLAVMVADAMMAPAWLIGGVLLWRREALGYVAGAGLLFQASILFVGVIMVVLLQPLLINAPLAVGDVIALFIMSLVCFVPFGLFMRAFLMHGAGATPPKDDVPFSDDVPSG
jgi:hypothetical protein